MLGCTLKGNQLWHCAAKPIVQTAIIANTSRALIQGPTEYESDALPTEPLRLFFFQYNIIVPIFRDTKFYCFMKKEVNCLFLMLKLYDLSSIQTKVCTVKLTCKWSIYKIFYKSFCEYSNFLRCTCKLKCFCTVVYTIYHYKSQWLKNKMPFLTLSLQSIVISSQNRFKTIKNSVWIFYKCISKIGCTHGHLG